MTAWLLLAVSAEAAPWLRELPDNEAGRSALESGRADEALKHFERIGEEGEGEIERRAAYNRGAALGLQERWNDALAAWADALDSDDAELRSDARFNRGLVYERQQKTPEAMEEYRRALLENPQNERARVNLERLLRMPPPPPQQQQEQQKQNGKSDESEQDEPSPGSPENESDDAQEQSASDEDEQQSQGDEQEKQEDQEGQPESPSQAEGRQTGEELTAEEAERLLRSLDAEAERSPLLESGKPPRDYDPSRDW